ncbi:POX family protein, putative isoform 1 [Hibiscus syriacus]|uniref:Aldehyde oxidase GLOX n=1 Tax=Hibiscus syriacus TaxID=106335 RepID=A0A6A3BK09_HIBSY|nr:aldehyde oxidase GLOX-like [Hibiscus syriacus]KAE8717330.1 POX family protein, putative isoform 1 [Hibiscus syriacus]
MAKYASSPSSRWLLQILIFTFMFKVRAQLPGTWELILPNAGIASMHTAVTRFNTVVLLDRTNIGPSRKMLPKGHCRYDRYDVVLKKDCFAHSVVFDLQTNQIRPLMILTDTWCSSGQFLPDGTLLQTGGDLDGFKKIRKFEPCEPGGNCDWVELKDVELASGRWYATNQILPDGTVIIVGGRGTNTVEYYPPRTNKNGAVELKFLADVKDNQMDNLYPYVHLLPNGHLFIFANNKAVMYDHESNNVIGDYPALSGGPRNYPSAGSSVMLALEGNFSTAVIVVCGGAQYGAFIERSTVTPAHGSCGRIVTTDPKPGWEMEDMPYGRIMGDMVMLPTGDTLIINGAQAGAQGFEMASSPCLYPVLYRPNQPVGLRFMTLNPGTVPRMYHSTANLLPDGRVLIAGSNPHYFYKFAAEFPTELRLEAFSPEYLSPDRANLRPVIEEIPETVRYGEAFDVLVSVPLSVVGIIEVNLGSAPFSTHSFSQGQRLVKLAVTPSVPEGGRYRIQCTAPPNGSVAPPSYYMVFAVNQGVPSVARWVHLVP